MPFNTGSEIQTHTLSPHKSGHRLIKTSRQPQGPGVARNRCGLRVMEQSRPPASHPQVRLGQPPGPGGLTRPGPGVSEQHLTAQPRADLAGRRSEVSPDVSTKSGWKHTSRGLAGRVAPLLPVTAPQQSCSAEGLWPALQTLAPHPGSQKTARACPAVWGEQRAAHSLRPVAQHGTHVTQAPSAAIHSLPACAWVTPGRAVLQQPLPNLSLTAGRLGGWVSAWQSVCAHLILRGPSVWEPCCQAAWPAPDGVIQCSDKQMRHDLQHALKQGRRSHSP